MIKFVATIAVAALSTVHCGIVTSGAVPAITFHRDNHAKRAAMGYASASARLRRAVLEAKSAAWDEEEVGWDEEDEHSAHQAQTAARELLAYVEKVLSPPREQKSSTGALRGTAAEANHTQIDHPVYQVGQFGLKSKLLEVDTPDSSDDEDVGEPHPYVHYKKIIHMISDAKNEIKVAKWDEDHEGQFDSTAKEEGKKVVFATGKLVSVLAQVISWAKAHQKAENSTAEVEPAKPASKPSLSSKVSAPPRALTAHSNSSTKVVTVNATKNSTVVPKAPNTQNKTNRSATVSNMTSMATSTTGSNKTNTAANTTSAAATASNSSNTVDIENEATKQAEVVESSTKKITEAVKELDSATSEIRKSDPSVEEVMSELDKASGKLEGATTRISLKIIAHKLVQDSQQKAKDQAKVEKATEQSPETHKPVVNVSLSNTSNIVHEASVPVEKVNVTVPATKDNVTQPAQEAPKHEVKITANVSLPKSLVKQSLPVKPKSPEEQMDELLNVEASKKEAEADKEEEERSKEQDLREKQEAKELKAEESQIEREQEIESEKEAEEKKEEADQLEQEEKEAEEEMEAEKEERKARALMRLAKKRRAKLSKAKSKKGEELKA